MVACASQDSSAPLGYDEARAQHLFTAGYQDVADIYIHEVAVADLAVAGLSSLAIIDPAIGIQRNGGSLRIPIDGRQIDRQSTRLNSSHYCASRMQPSA